MKDFDNKLEQLRELYNEKPTETINEINKAIIKIKNGTNKRETKEEKKSKNALISGIFAVCIFLISIVNIKYGTEQFMMYFLERYFS